MALKQLQRLCSTRSNLFYYELIIGYLNGVFFLLLLLDEKDGIECEGLKNYTVPTVSWSSFFNLLSS